MVGDEGGMTGAVPPQPEHSPSISEHGGQSRVPTAGLLVVLEEARPSGRSRVIPGCPVHEQQETELKQRSENRMENEAGLETELW